MGLDGIAWENLEKQQFRVNKCNEPMDLPRTNTGVRFRSGAPFLQNESKPCNDTVTWVNKILNGRVLYLFCVCMAGMSDLDILNHGGIPL